MQFDCYFPPPGVKGTGTWSDRDPNGDTCKIWHYMRDTILKDVQKFYGALNAVLNMGLSGVTHQQKVNIAVAIFLKKVKDGSTHYQHKDFDPNKWRLYKAYLILKETGKLAEPIPASRPSEELAAQSDHPSESNKGFITDSSQLKTTTRGRNKSGFSGRDAAKKAQEREDDLKRKTSALRSFARTEKKKLKVMQDIEAQVKTQNIIAMLSHPAVSGNRRISEKLAKDVLVQLGVAKEKKRPAATATRGMVPGDQLDNGGDNECDVDSDEDDSLSSSSSSASLPVTEEACRSCDEAMARGQALRARQAAAETSAAIEEAVNNTPV